MSYFDDNEDWIIFGHNNHRMYEHPKPFTARTTVGSVLYIVFGRDVILMRGYAQLEKLIESGITPTKDMFAILDDTEGKFLKITIRRVYERINCNTK